MVSVRSNGRTETLDAQGGRINAYTFGKYFAFFVYSFTVVKIMPSHIPPQVKYFSSFFVYLFTVVKTVPSHIPPQVKYFESFVYLFTVAKQMQSNISPQVK